MTLLSALVPRPIGVPEAAPVSLLVAPTAIGCSRQWILGRDGRRERSSTVTRVCPDRAIRRNGSRGQRRFAAGEMRASAPCSARINFVPRGRKWRLLSHPYQKLHVYPRGSTRSAEGSGRSAWTLSFPRGTWPRTSPPGQRPLNRSSASKRNLVPNCRAAVQWTRNSGRSAPLRPSGTLQKARSTTATTGGSGGCATIMPPRRSRERQEDAHPTAAPTIASPAAGLRKPHSTAARRSCRLSSRRRQEDALPPAAASFSRAEPENASAVTCSVTPSRSPSPSTLTSWPLRTAPAGTRSSTPTVPPCGNSVGELADVDDLVRRCGSGS